MRKLQIALGLLLLTAIAGIANAQNVNVDYNHQVNFAQFHSFEWVKPPRLGSPLRDNSVRNAIDAALTAKGWQLVHNANAGVGVTANGAVRQRRSLQSFYGGLKGWVWWGWGPGMGTPATSQTYDAGTLLIDLFDIHNKQLIWRGTAGNILSSNPEKGAQAIRTAIQNMFGNFPPGS
jgi:hypothetical protein